MRNRNYWNVLFTAKTWEEFIKAGSNTTGFNERRWSFVRKIKSSDYLICYMTGISRFIGILEVIDEPYKDASIKIWSEGDYPCRINVKPIIILNIENALPIKKFSNQLSFLNESNPNGWIGIVRSSPTKIELPDGEQIYKELENAKTNPIIYPIDKKKKLFVPDMMESNIGKVSVPHEEEENNKADNNVSDHLKMQWMLLELGNKMGYDVWVARNDRGKAYKNQKFADLPRLRNEIPLQFDNATNKIIELIDVLWIRDKSYIAAFEIESTTSIYSGLLRMSDLISMQPNVNIPMYIVAPEERRDKVITEINRATFSRLDPPLSEICRFISFPILEENFNKFKTIMHCLKFDFINELSESCYIEEI